MSLDDIFGEPRIELAEVLNHILDKGVVLKGEVMLAVADIDLIQLDLGLLLTAVESATRRPRVSGARTLGLAAPRPESRAEASSGSTMESQVVDSLDAPVLRVTQADVPMPRICLSVLILTPTKSKTGSRSSS